MHLVRMLSDLHPLYFGRKGVRHTPNGGWTHPWKKVDSLRNYLLLTCFDVLGGRTRYVDFQGWLVSRGSATARERTIASLSEAEAPAKAALALHKAYLKEHGATQAFLRFIREVLPSESRDELFYSIKITEIDIAKNVGVREIQTPKTKEDFLFDVRNKFTHEARDTGSPAAGLFPDWGKPIIIDGAPLMGWEPIHHVDRASTRTEYAVRNWPNALVMAVEAGTNAYKAAAGDA